MNELYTICFGMSAIFLLFGVAFCVLKENACNMIWGYNLKSREKRAAYDEKKLSRDTRTFHFICGGIFLLGGLGCLFWSDRSFVIALVAWLVYLVLHLLLDRSKNRFEKKYRKS